MKVFLAFFRFYYCLITKKRKRFNIINNPNEATSILITPVAFFVICMALFLIFNSIFTTVLMVLSAPVVIINMVILHNVREGYRADMIREREREIKEELRKQTEVWEREWREYLREAEEERIRSEIRRERLRKEANEAYRKRERERQEELRRIDRNLENALKLLGLKHGFTEKDVKSAYRKLSKIHHPDLGGLEVNFIRLTKAYDYLMKKI